MTLRVGWFSTGRGEGSRALLAAAAEAIRSDALDAEIAFVFCNRERGEHEATDGFLDLVASFGIPAITLSSRRFRRDRNGELSEPSKPLPSWRIEYDRAVRELLASHSFEVGVLAGYMLIFTDEMAGAYPFLNLHPAEPTGPIGTWQEVIWQLIDSHAGRSGVMIHLATEELDRGPPVAYCSFELRGLAFDQQWEQAGTRRADDLRAEAGEEQPLFREIRRHGVMRERLLVIATLQALAEGRVRIEARRVVDAHGHNIEGGLDLTAEVNAELAAQLSM